MKESLGFLVGLEQPLKESFFLQCFEDEEEEEEEETMAWRRPNGEESRDDVKRKR
jgi:hypothetical protein